VLTALLLLVTVAVEPAQANDELPAEQDNGAENGTGCKAELVESDSSLVIRRLARGPLAPDGSLTFTSGLCVYLPPGYVTSGLAYPVLYLLHGGGGAHHDWVTMGEVQKTMDAAIATDSDAAAIVVMPDGTDAQWYDAIDRTLLNERYVLDFVLPYADSHFRTISERAGRAIDGLSNGGYGAMHLAAKAPDRFVAAGGMSSNLGARSFGGLGNPLDSPAYYHGNVPAELVGNLDGIDLTLDIGATCSSDLSRDLCGRWAFEQLFLLDNRHFRDRLAEERAEDGSDGVWEYRETEGSHAWWWWSAWLRERHLPFLLARLADPRPVGVPAPSSEPRRGFRYRSIADSFSVWGYDVSVTRDVREFLDLRDVDANGMVVQGSGGVRITTAPLYTPRKTYVVSGAGGPAQTVPADQRGRISFLIDLGNSHEWEQFSPQATALEAAGGYWTVREIAIARS